MKKTVYFDEEIGQDSLQRLIKNIGDISMVEELEIKINSSGGLTGVAQQIVDYLQTLKSKGIKIVTNALAYCDSSAILIFGVGDERVIDKYNESFLIHEPTAGIDNAKAEDAAGFLEYIVKIRQNIIDSYNSLFGVPKETASALIRQERSLTPEKALELGFATKIGRTTNNKIIFEAVNKSSKPMNVSQSEIDNARKSYFEAVNMTYSEFDAWANGKCSKKIIDRRPIARTSELLLINAGDWNEKHYRWALQSISFISNTRKNKTESVLVKECGLTKRDIILKNWGFDLSKTVEKTKNKKFSDFKSLGLLRYQMPQIEDVNLAASMFEKMLGSQGVVYCQIKAGDLLPCQLSVDDEKVNSISEAKVYEDKLFLVSEDNHIIDGHHCWAAILSEKGEDYLCNCVKIDLDVFSIMMVLKLI